MDPEAKLVVRLGQGDEEALDELYERLSGRVHTLALTLLKSREEAEEVVQDTFLALYRQASSYATPDRSPRAFIYTIARNQALSRLRRRKARPLKAEGWEVDDPRTAFANPADPTTKLTTTLYVERLLAQLDEEERQLLEEARYGGRMTVDRWHLCKDGSRFFASGVLTALYDDQGTPDGYTKIVRDLTRQREAEEQKVRLLGELKALNAQLERRVDERTEALQLQNDALKSSERRFEQVFQSGPVASCLVTLENDLFLDVNEAFLQFTGYTKDEVLGRSLLELNMWSSKEDRDALKRAEDEQGSFRDLELHLQTQGEGDRDILASGEIINLGGEQVNLKMFYDVTELKRTEV